MELSSQLNEHKGNKETQNGQSGFVQNVSGENWFPGQVRQSIIKDYSRRTLQRDRTRTRTRTDTKILRHINGFLAKAVGRR